MGSCKSKYKVCKCRFDQGNYRGGRKGKGIYKGKGDEIATQKGVCSKGQGQYIKIHVYGGGQS